MIRYPHIDPVLIHLGPLAIRWYGMAYLMGVLLGAVGFKKAVQKTCPLTWDNVMDLAAMVMLGIVLGGRLGYVLVYDPGYFWQNPGDILALWQGGMSFHGGALGAGLAVLFFAKKNQKPLWPLWDGLALVSTLGIFFGRVANFINGELYGRFTTVPWGMVFPAGGLLPRHPSQLYEAVGEGLILGLVLLVLHRRVKPGQLLAFFVMGYGLIRFCLERFREPDVQVGFLWGGLTMGQYLCLGMVVAGVVLALIRSRSLGYDGTS
ncbi:MAG: prolipoprotein diacylglyceryl transferase [Candidatus Margulisiibacteriota bacterium]